MYCKNCENKLCEGDQYCSNCGKKITDLANNNSDNQEDGTGNLIGLIAFICFILGFVISPLMLLFLGIGFILMLIVKFNYPNASIGKILAWLYGILVIIILIAMIFIFSICSQLTGG